jgi:uncharacterized protein YecE (DUF72 family)
MIRLGTSGFSYDDWIGPVYPPELPRWQWLGHYATLFDTVELNVTYYRHADRKTASGWVQRTPDGFLFTVKAHGSLTHERQDPEAAAFRESLAPLTEQGRLGCVLAQFPHSFHATPQNADYLDVLRDHLGGLPVVVEFRDAGWLRDETFEQLRRLQFGFCCVDEPQLKGLMPPLTAVTGPLAYVRLHGRNAAKWWEHEKAWERYDYTYRDEELCEWVPRLRALDAEASLTLVYANNHYRGQSVEALQALGRLLSTE